MKFSTALLLAATIPPDPGATELQWDTSASAGIQDGSGTWDTSTANWTANGGSSRVAYAAGNKAIFGGNSSTGAAGTVTVSGTQTTDRIIFGTPGSGNYTLSGGTVALTGTHEIQSNSDVTIASILAGTAGLLKTGAGKLTLQGANTLSGGITISAGTLKIATTTAAYPAGNNIAIASGKTLELTVSNLTIDGVISGAGELYQSAGSGLVLTGNNTQTGTMNTLPGNLTLGNGGTSGNISQTALSYGGTVKFNRSDSWTFSPTLTRSNGSTPGIESIGSGTTRLSSGLSTMAGPIRCTAGTIVSSQANLGIYSDSTIRLQLNGGTYSYDGAATAQNGDIQLMSASGSVLDVSGAGIFAADIGSTANNYSMTKTGSGTWRVSNTNLQSFGATMTLAISAGKLLFFSGTGGLGVVTLNSGSNMDLDIGGTKTIGSVSGAGDIIIRSGNTLSINGSTSDTLSGVISNAGGLARSGSGKTILTGTCTHTGTTAISGTATLGGTGVCAGSAHTVAAGATVQAGVSGSGGTYRCKSLDATANTARMSVTSDGTNVGKITVDGLWSGSALNNFYIDFLDAMASVPSGTYNIIEAGSVSAFTSIYNIGTNSSGRTISTPVRAGNNLQITIT